VCEPEPVYSAWDEVLLAREMAAFAKSGLPEGFRLVDVRDLALAPSTPAFEAAADRQAFVDIRNHYRMSLIDVGEEPMKGRKRNRYLKNLDAMRRFESYLATVSLDRFVLFSALGGILDRHPDEAAARRVFDELAVAAGPERDAVISAAGRARAPGVVRALAAAAKSVDVDDRRSVASALASHVGSPQAIALARSLTTDSDETVRAEATFALGSIAG